MFAKLTVAVFCAFASFSSAKLVDDVDALWEKFKTTYHKKYTADEEISRKSVFTQSMARADKRNELNGAISFGVTKFSDLTEKEFSVLLGRKDKAHTPSIPIKVRDPANAKNIKNLKKPKVDSLADGINWAEFGVVNPVKNQGQCGSCWAFSAAETVESQWAMNGNSLWEFSPQQIASCTTTMYGCGGGDTVAAYEYLMNTTATPGLGSSWFAPYTQSMYTSCSGTTCTQACDSLDVPHLEQYVGYTGPYAAVTGYEYATAPCSSGRCANQDTATLASNVAVYGPASVCVNAGTWNDYVGGVLTAAAGGSSSAFAIDHCVQLIGYNATAPTPYWIVKNSWATNWGVDGLILLEYPANTCGLANEATFVTLGN
jgi:C1A family cysteine protease